MKFPIYLDNQATTPVDPLVFEAMKPYFLEKYGNASSKNHSYGWEAESAVEYARKITADFINCDPKEIYFTSGATESINLAQLGAAESYSKKGNHIITSVIEHSAVLDSIQFLERKGFEITRLPVNREGMLDLDQLKDSITDKTILVSIMTANNEIGTINNISEIGRICRENYVLFHTDATQAIGKIPFDVQSSNVDIASFTSHKVYGPKGIGAIFIRNKSPRIKLSPLFYGGGHERSIRPGTLNVPGIVGFGKALELSKKYFDEETKRIGYLRNILYKGLKSYLDDVYVNGSMKERIPNNLNLCFKNIRSENFISNLREVAVSTGAACSSESLKPSHVLKAIGLSDELARSSIRFSIGRFNTEEEINYVIEKSTETINNLRIISSNIEIKE